MIAKKILAIGVGVALSMTAVSAMAVGTLTLNNTTSAWIGVSCNGNAGVPIINGIPLSLSDKFISQHIFKSFNGNCTFTVYGGSNTPVGTAIFDISKGYTTATVVSYTQDSPYTVVITPGTGAPSSAI